MSQAGSVIEHGDSHTVEGQLELEKTMWQDSTAVLLRKDHTTSQEQHQKGWILFPFPIFRLPLPQKNIMHLPNDLIYINTHIIGRRMHVYLAKREVTAADTCSHMLQVAGEKLLPLIFLPSFHIQRSFPSFLSFSIKHPATFTVKSIYSNYTLF